MKVKRSRERVLIKREMKRRGGGDKTEAQRGARLSQKPPPVLRMRPDLQIRYPRVLLALRSVAPRADRLNTHRSVP